MYDYIHIVIYVCHIMTYIYKEIYYEGLAHTMMEADRSQDLQRQA